MEYVDELRAEKNQGCSRWVGLSAGVLTTSLKFAFSALEVRHACIHHAMSVVVNGSRESSEIPIDEIKCISEM